MGKHLMMANVNMRYWPLLNINEQLDTTRDKQIIPFLACGLLRILTSENVQSLDNKATSIGDVWLATQKPQFFGRYSSLWRLMTAESDRAMIRNPINVAVLFIQRRRPL